MIVDNLIKQGSEILKKENITSHHIDAELLLCKIIGRDRVFLLMNGEFEVSLKEASNYLNFIMRRKQREPISYITQKKEFWSLDFDVNHNVLIPRPETEIIVDQVVRRFSDKSSLNVLDIGTGSGCILLSILKELKKSYGVGIDKSFKALNIANIHAKKNKLKINYITASPEKLKTKNKFDIILNMEVIEHVSNLNYFIKSCTKLLKKNGLMFVATINRTLKSYLFAIVGAEYILKWLPIGTHDWNSFIKPDELIKISTKYNLKSNGVHGMIYNPLLDQWNTSKDSSVNYIASFIKK